MFDLHLTWLLDHRMEVLVVLILLWSMLTRIALGNVRGSQMALFAAPPVVLVTWVWILDLNVLDWRDASSLMWWTVATGFALGMVLDWRDVSQRVVWVLHCSLPLVLLASRPGPLGWGL